MRKTEEEPSRNSFIQDLIDAVGSQPKLVEALRTVDPDQTYYQSYVWDWLTGRREISARYFPALITVAKQYAVDFELEDLHPRLPAALEALE